MRCRLYWTPSDFFQLAVSGANDLYKNGATRGHMSPLAITKPSQPLCAGNSGSGRVGMRLSAYFGKRLHVMLSWTRVHV